MCMYAYIYRFMYISVYICVCTYIWCKYLKPTQLGSSSYVDYDCDRFPHRFPQGPVKFTFLVIPWVQ